LQKEEASASGGHGEAKSTRAVDLDVQVNASGHPVPGLLQNVDERTNDRPWWMDAKVVARIEMADQETQPEPEPDHGGGNAVASDGLSRDDAAAKGVGAAPGGGSVKDKAALFGGKK
jgi:hypothetical protein